MYAIDVQSKPATWFVWVSMSGAPGSMWMVLGPMLSKLNYEVVPVGGRPKIGCPLQYKRILARDGTDSQTTLTVNNTLL